MVPRQHFLYKLSRYGIRQTRWNGSEASNLNVGNQSFWMGNHPACPWWYLACHMASSAPLPACGLKSMVRLFADDCILNRSVSNARDFQVLQDNLSLLTKWEKFWQMQFNVKKLYAMSTAINKVPLGITYRINQFVNEWFKPYPYLDMTLADNLTSYIDHGDRFGKDASLYHHWSQLFGRFWVRLPLLTGLWLTVETCDMSENDDITVRQ